MVALEKWRKTGLKFHKFFRQANNGYIIIINNSSFSYRILNQWTAKFKTFMFFRKIMKCFNIFFCKTMHEKMHGIMSTE